MEEFQLQHRTVSAENSSVEENTCMTSFKDNQVSMPPKRFRFGLSDDGKFDSSQEYKEPSSYYSETWLTIIK